MITLYTSSLIIGGVFGFVLGMAISFWSCYIVDKQMSPNDRFSNGWEAGCKYGKTIKEDK